jgi:hypothetical protein
MAEKKAKLRARTKEDRARKDKDDCDRAESKAERGSHASEGNETGCGAGWVARRGREGELQVLRANNQ